VPISVKRENETIMAEASLNQLLKAQYEKYGKTKVAMRRKDYGIWNEYTWKDYYENVKYFGLGLISLGLKAGEKVAIIGENDPEWYWAALAAQAARGVGVGIFPDCAPAEVKYVIENSDTVFVVAEDQEQTDKVIQIRDEIPNVRKVIYWDSKGMYGYIDPFIMSFYDVVKLGREYEKFHPGLLESLIAQSKPDEIAVMCYTSGTTGLPKGAMASNRYITSAGECLFAIDGWRPEDDYLSYLSPAWGTEWNLGLGTALRTGTSVCFAEKPETIQANIREIAPRVVFYNPRMWETLNSMVQSKISDTHVIYRFAYNLMLPVGYRIADARLRKERVGLFWRCLYAVAEWLLFRPLRDKLGLVNIRWAYSAGAGISPDILRFFQSINVNLKQIYGLTESQMNCIHRDGDVNPETCGPPLPGHQVRISEAGEILLKPAEPFSGYYKNPEATKARFDSHDWILSGDAGYITEDGHLVVMDRLEYLMELGEGRKFSPDFIETRLRFSPYIRDVMIIGGKGKGFVTAIIIIDFDNVGKWAEDHHLTYTTFTDLSQKPQVSDLVLNDIRRINAVLPDWARVKKYLLFHKEFDPDEAEMTRTRKIRRSFMEDKYRALVDSLYSNAEEVIAEAPITYQDGRKGIVKTTITIRDLGRETA
jgi:long-chain acyl-CoA synthetase